MTVNTYGGLKSSVQQWMARTTDTLLDERFDDLLTMQEVRMYYGYATEMPDHPLRSEPLRIPEMETVDESFSLSSGTVAQPTNFVELISAKLNSPESPMEIVSQRVLDGYGSQSIGGTYKIAVSGTNFRFYDEPTSGTATIRYYRKLSTPTASTSNAILTNYPNVYLFGCLLEASILTQDKDGATSYLQLYNASVAGLNSRTQRLTASSNPVMRVRAGLTP